MKCDNDGNFYFIGKRVPVLAGQQYVSEGVW